MKNNLLRNFVTSFISVVYYFVPHSSQTFGKWIREGYYKSKLKKLGSRVSFSKDVEMLHPEKVIVGNESSIGRFCTFEGNSSITIANRVVFKQNVIIKSGKYPKGEIKVGNDSYVGPNCYLDGVGGITIGSDVLISPNCKLITSQHNYLDKKSKINSQGREFSRITVGKDVWIGANSVILPGIKIGDGAVIGAGSVVTKNVGEFEVVVGIPAKRIKMRK